MRVKDLNPKNILAIRKLKTQIENGLTELASHLMRYEASSVSYNLAKEAIEEGDNNFLARKIISTVPTEAATRLEEAQETYEKIISQIGELGKLNPRKAAEYRSRLDYLIRHYFRM